MRNTVSLADLLKPYLANSWVAFGLTVMLFFGLASILIGTAIPPEGSRRPADKKVLGYFLQGFLIAALVVAIGFCQIFFYEFKENSLTASAAGNSAGTGTDPVKHRGSGSAFEHPMSQPNNSGC